LKQKPTFQQQGYDRGITGVAERPIEKPIYVYGQPGRDEKVAGGEKLSIDWQDAARNIVPYVSNIANAFRKTPRPSRPEQMQYQSFATPNLEQARTDVRRAQASFNAGTDRTLDAQTAASAQAAMQGQSLNQLSRISEEESNQRVNSGIAIARTNQQVDYINTLQNNRYAHELTEARVSDIENASANVSNAADKYVAIDNENKKQSLDQERYKILSTIFDQPLMQRLEDRYKKAGVYRRGGKLTGYSNGVIKK
jgi:hypothetical protein